MKARSVAPAKGLKAPLNKPAVVNIKDVPLSQQKDVLLQKLKICSLNYDFTEPLRDAEQKELKRNALRELVEYVGDPRNVSNVCTQAMPEIIDMISRNIFRPLSRRSSEVDFDPDEDEPATDPSWPHLQVVYELLLRLIVSDGADVKHLKTFVTSQFIHDLLELFDSEDVRERDYLKNILHRIYAKLVPRRKLIRKAINDCLYKFIHETERFNGVPELLDILASIISGFAVPLRDEHKEFFVHIIVPLHKVKTSPSYHEQLNRCASLFLNKDPSLAPLLLEGMLKYWPFANSTKASLFLTEMGEIIELADADHLKSASPKIFKQLARCIQGQHFQVSERALYAVESESMLRLVKAYRDVAFPILAPVVAKIQETHWHPHVQEAALSVRTLLSEIDVAGFNFYVAHSRSDFEQQQKSKADRQQRWNALEKMAKSKNPSFVPSTVPYSESVTAK
eukprot:GILJ01000567.1.p1 GENE.GILJ01000567.1~~GILJ01000567.1.p1  ORF type:complete len:452 (+),score=85.49 GILJ01000567.1:173-1528(+)